MAIITMFFMFAMISFVTNMAAPFGNIWKQHYEWSGMLGNLMNFAAYLFMGIPAGKMLARSGYKKTALSALGVGFVGMAIQLSASYLSVGIAALVVYLLGAFVCGFCVCMLNTVVNPMLNMLGGGGNKGNQLVQSGGALNSLAGTLTPLLAGMMIGTITKSTSLTLVRPLLLIALAVFALSFLVIYFVSIPEPERKATAAAGKDKHSPWSFRHFVLGVIAIFFYVGIEVGIPGELNFYLSDANATGAGIAVNGALIGGALASCYWFLMLVGRVCSSAISGKVSAKVQLTTVSAVAIIFVVAAIFTPKTTRVNVPGFLYDPIEKTVDILTQKAELTQEQAECYVSQETPDSAALALIAPKVNALAEVFNVKAQDNVAEETLVAAVADKLTESKKTPSVPVSAIFLILCGLCTSLMWGGIFNLAVEGLGKYTEQASGIFMMMVVGGGVMPLIQEFLGRSVGYLPSYWLVAGMLAFLLFYALVGCKNVNKNIKVD